jgi:hypothetical protein
MNNTATGLAALLSNINGNENTATGASSLLFNNGSHNTANGFEALYTNNTGNSNTATGVHSLHSSNGNQNTANGYDALYNNSGGNDNTATGFGSLAFSTTGINNTAVGSGSLISVTTGSNNTAIGYNANVGAGSLTNATAVGAFARADINNSMVLGSINGINGATASTNVGIGTTTPHAALQFGNIIDNRRIVLWENTNSSIDFYGFGINSGTLRYNVPNSGNVHSFMAGNTVLLNLFGTGNATLAGILTQLSDARLKRDITPINSTINDIQKINAYSYYWIDENRDRDQQIGLLAQEVEKVFPRLVKRDAAGLLSVNYNGFVPLLIKGMQEQQQQINDLKKEIDLLKEQNKMLLQLLKNKN